MTFQGHVTSSTTSSLDLQ